MLDTLEQEKPIRLSQVLLREATLELAGREARLAEVVKVHGFPPLWARQPGFATLVHIILEQQVSLASAKAAFDRLKTRLGQITPEGVLTLSDRELKAIGFSQQKTSYARGLAVVVAEGRLNLGQLARLNDEEVRERLTALKGIGNWTADIYLLMALRRPDVWPVGDLALAVAAQRLWELPNRPSLDELEALAALWKPWRSVAARLLWHFYLES